MNDSQFNCNYLESISGKTTEKIMYQLKNCICKVFSDNNEIYTGFFCKIPYKSKILQVLISNNKIIKNNDKEIKISINDDNEFKNIKINDKRKILRCDKLGVIFIEIKPKDKIKNFLDLDDNIDINTNDDLEQKYKSKTIYILHYPDGKNGEISYGLINELVGKNLYFQGKVKKSSIGAPIILLENCKIIGINMGTTLFDFNCACFIKNPILKFNKIDEYEELNELTIEYKLIDYNKSLQIRIFGKTFVSNNINNCKLLIDGKIFVLSEFYQKNKSNNNNLIIKLIETNKIKDMSRMFHNCPNVLSVKDFSNWNTHRVNNLKNLFHGCSSLSSLPDISNWDISQVKNISNLFNDCRILKSMPDISKWNTSNVEKMKGLFNNCQSLSSLPDISKWNLRKIKDISNMFSFCSSLQALPDISKWNINKSIELKGIFNGCSSLLEIPDISKWNISKTKDISYLFNNCCSLKSLPDISKWNTSNVINMNNLFDNCSSLLYLPDISKWDTKEVQNMESMFSNCSSLLYLPNISKWNTENVTNINYLFRGCFSLSIIPDISKWNMNRVINMNYIFSQCRSLSELPDIGKKFNEMNLYDRQFDDCINLSKIPDGFHYIDDDDNYDGCVNLLPQIEMQQKQKKLNSTHECHIF